MIEQSGRIRKPQREPDIRYMGLQIYVVGGKLDWNTVAPYAVRALKAYGQNADYIILHADSYDEDGLIEVETHVIQTDFESQALQRKRRAIATRLKSTRKALEKAEADAKRLRALWEELDQEERTLRYIAETRQRKARVRYGRTDRKTGKKERTEVLRSDHEPDTGGADAAEHQEPSV